MGWDGIVGHDGLKTQFQRGLSRGRLSGTFLFVGPGGIGKRTFAREIAKALLCEGEGASSPGAGTTPRTAACDDCAACRLVAADNHPDLLTVQRIPNKNRLLLEQFIGEEGKRGRSGLCYEISLKPFRGTRKIAIIDDADLLGIEAANALLKTLEEPPPGSLIILIATSEQRQLPTIRSRSQIVRFAPLSPVELARVIANCGLLEEFEEQKDRICSSAAGSVELALELSDGDVLEFRETWLNQLATLDPAADRFANRVGQFVDQAGKDAASRRLRIQLLSDFAIEFFQAWLREVARPTDAAFASDQGFDSHDSPHDAQMQQAVKQACQAGAGMQQVADRIVECLQRCFLVKQQVLANASQANVLECWLVDLGRICRGEAVACVV